MYMSPSNYVEFYNKISYYEGKYYNDIRTLVEYYSNMLGLHEQKDWSLKLSIKFEPTIEYEYQILKSQFTNKFLLFSSDKVKRVVVLKHKTFYYHIIKADRDRIYDIMKEISSKPSHVGSPVNNAVGWKV